MATTRSSIVVNRQFQQTCQHILWLGCVLFLVTFAGCSKRYDNYPEYTAIRLKQYENQGVGRFKSSYLAEQIDDYYRGSNPGPIGVATFVNVDDLYSTSTFGRMYSEQIMSELAMQGYDVVELRHSDALQFLTSTGEFALSRDVAVVRRERDLGGMVVGTYAVSPERVYVNARLIDPSNSIILAAGSVEMDKTSEIKKMLRGGSIASTLERIPVQHLGFSHHPYGWSNPWGQPHPYDVEETMNSLPVPPQPLGTTVAPEISAGGMVKGAPAKK